MIFWVGSVYGSARLLQSIMAVWIFVRNVLFNAAITPSHPARRADIDIVVKLVLQARQHKAMRLYRIGIRATSR